MIKELVLAIILGGILGFGFTGGYLTLRQKSQAQNQVIITEPTIIPTPATSQIIVGDENKDPTNKLTITSPENNLLVSTSALNIIGSTIGNSQIVINTATDNFTGKSDPEGLFDIKIELEAGLNLIKISSIDSDGNQIDTELNITYSTAKI